MCQHQPNHAICQATICNTPATEAYKYVSINGCVTQYSDGLVGLPYASRKHHIVLRNKKITLKTISTINHYEVV
jgi:hypothetical protein